MAARRSLSATQTAVNPSTSDLSTMDCDVLTTEDCSGSEDEVEEETCVESGMPSNFSTYWKTAMQNPYNFTTWTKLVAYSEKEKNLAACRKSYDAFLSHLPLYHIYWKKYAEIELHFGNKEEALKVYERAVKSIPLNVTIWDSYIQNLKRSMDMTQSKSIDKLRGLYKEALNAAGMSFHSDQLWKSYIEFETQQKNLKEVLVLYDRVLTIPTQQYKTHYERFRSFLNKYSPVEILSTEEREWIRLKIQIEVDNDQIASEDIDDGLEPLTECDKAMFREHIVKVREQLYLLNEAEFNKRSTFERGIKRLYFYAIPMNIKQIKNWRSYLEFERSQGQHDRIVLLYERCLMTCALYEEFWLSYANYIESHSVEAARSVYERACRIHLPLKCNLHLQWAAFEEKHGCLDTARDILSNLENVVPGLAIIRLKRVGLERRCGNLQEAEKLLTEAMHISSNKDLASFYAVKLSRFILKIQRNPHNARDVLKEALQKDPDNTKLHLCMLEVEMETDDAADASLVWVENALKTNLPNDSKRILAERRCEFIEDFGSSLTSWFDAYSELQTYLKRKGDDEKEEKDDKKAKMDSKECFPPGTLPLPYLFKLEGNTSFKKEFPPKDSYTKTASASINSVSTVVNRFTTVVSSFPSSASYSKRNVQTAAPPLMQHSNNYYHNTQPQPYYPPARTYGPPPNAQIQPLFRNQFPDYPPPVQHPPPVPFASPQAPPFVDQSAMPFRMPTLFSYGSWFPNFGTQGWNQFFPPQ